MHDYPITVVIPTYNHEKYICEAIESVRRQTLFNECIVIVSDDCSTDETRQVAMKAAEASHIEIRHPPRNMGTMRHHWHLIKHVQTPFIAILEGDDVWLGNRRLELMKDMLERHRKMGMCFSACVIDDEFNKDRFINQIYERNRILNILDIITHNPIVTFSNCLYRTEELKKAFVDIGHYDGRDWLCNMTIALRCDIGFLKEPSTLYRVHSLGQWSGLNEEEKIVSMRRDLEAMLVLGPADLRDFVEEEIRRLHGNSK